MFVLFQAWDRSHLLVRSKVGLSRLAAGKSDWLSVLPSSRILRKLVASLSRLNCFRSRVDRCSASSVRQDTELGHPTW